MSAASTTPDPSPVTLSLCVIARDEEDNLPGCLASVAGVVDEMVIVDTGSRDTTADVAREAGARVVTHRWRDDFAAARNAALEAARGEWILVLDADERLAPEAGRLLRDAVRQGGFDCGFLPLHHASQAHASIEEVLAGDARRDEPVLLPRLLRRTPDLRWEGVVHESVDAWYAAGRRGVRIEAPIVHYGSVEEVRRDRDKQTRNRELLRRRVAMAPDDAIARTWLARELLRTGEEARAWRHIQRAWSAVAAAREAGEAGGGPAASPVPVATLRGFMALSRRDLGTALATVEAARRWSGDHPNLDVLQAAAVEQLVPADDAVLEGAVEALDRARSRQGELFTDELLPGATTWSADTLSGLLRLRQGRPDAAQEHLDRALAHRPEHLPARLGSVRALLDLDRPDEATRALAPLGDGAGPDVQALAAWAAVRRRDWDEAAARLKNIRGPDAGDFGSIHHEALAEHVEHVLDGRRLLAQLVEGEPAPPDRPVDELVAEGERAFGEGRPEEAAGAFISALAAEPWNVRAWIDLGVAVHATGYADVAAWPLETATLLAPGRRDAHLNLARLLHEIERPAEAASTLRDLLDHHPDDADALAMLEAMGVQGRPRPVALFAVRDDCGDHASAVVMTRKALAQRGFRVRHAHADVLEVLGGGAGDPETVTALFERTRPALVAVDPGREDAASWSARASQAGIPLMVFGESDDPEGLSLPSEPVAALDALEQAGLALPESPAPADPAPEPHLSIVVPTFERSRCLLNLLDRLSLQDLDPGFFEVVVVDDGSATPVEDALGPQDRPYALKLVRQDNAGPARARNTALEHCRAPWLLIYNDDAIPALDNVRQHLVAQARAERPEAVLGTFDFPARACQHPFVDLMQHSTMLFEYPEMEPGELNSWRFFYTCNLSVPRRSVEAVGGFDDEHFRHAICEDVELGYRLEAREGVRVRYRPDIQAWHDHDMDVTRYRKRTFLLGYYHDVMRTLHGDLPHVGTFRTGVEDDEAVWLAVRARTEQERAAAEASYENVLRLEHYRTPPDDELRQRLRETLEPQLQRINAHDYRRGQVYGHAGLPIAAASRDEDLADELTSVIIPNLNGMPHMVGALESLRRTTRDPVELVVVDNGSTDGSLEWLREQPDVRLLELGENLGAPAARNRGLEVAHGETIVLCDNDVVFTPHWRERLIAHLERWPDIGLVGPMSDYVTGAQKVAEPPGATVDLDAWAEAWHEENRGQHTYVYRLILFFVMGRRELFEKIGGIDERYGRWGFEDDDLSLRVARAGYKQRVAGDCFIQHLGSRTARSANLDYDALLLRNWEVFKDKWRLDPGLPYGTAYDPGPIVAQGFDPEHDFVPFRRGADPGPVVLLDRG